MSKQVECWICGKPHDYCPTCGQTQGWKYIADTMEHYMVHVTIEQYRKFNEIIAALEAENASLRNKYEGAFGFSAKPTIPAKANSLYDDAIDDVHFHK